MQANQYNHCLWTLAGATLCRSGHTSCRIRGDMGKPAIHAVFCCGSGRARNFAHAAGVLFLCLPSHGQHGVDLTYPSRVFSIPPDPLVFTLNLSLDRNGYDLAMWFIAFAMRRSPSSVWFFPTACDPSGNTPPETGVGDGSLHRTRLP